MSQSSVITNHYHGREQAQIKHALLRGYLQKVLLIVGSSATLGITELCYVDCFAGPWDVEEEGIDKTTSIGISLEILAGCRDELAKHKGQQRLRALFIEKDDEAFARLQDYLSRNTPVGIEVEAMHGNFLALREQIRQWCGEKAFAFFFVDPTGWTEIKIDNLRPLLARPRSEFLITFVYDWINRLVSNPGWEEDVREILGESIKLPGRSPREREDAVVETYRRNICKAMTSNGKNLRARSAYRRVLDPAKDRTKYHLIYLTRHPRGIIEFVEWSEKVESLQTTVRASKKDEIKAEATGMSDLFGAESYVDHAVGRPSSSEVQQFWLKWLAPSGRRVDAEAFADILEDTDWFPTDLQAAMGSLINQGVVVNPGIKRRRSKNHVDWKKGEILELVAGPK